MGGGVGERMEICLLSIKCQLTKYDNFIILNPVLLQKEFLCKTMVNISNISNVLFWLSICKPSARPDPSKIRLALPRRNSDSYDADKQSTS